MSMTNCINCGAAKDTEEMKCPFCGTTYFDLTALDLDNGTPVACVFRMPEVFSNIQKVTMLARPRLDRIEYDEPDIISLYLDNRVVERVQAPLLPQFKLTFQPLEQKDGRFITVYTDKEGL